MVIKKIRGKYYYKDSKNKILIKSNNINSSGLFDNLGLSKIADLELSKIIERQFLKYHIQKTENLNKGKLRKHLNKDILL